MNMNVVSLFPTLSASVSQGASLDSVAALPFHAECPQLGEQVGLWWLWGQLLGGSPGANLTPSRRSLATRSLWRSLGSGLGFSSLDVESSGMGVHFWLAGFGHWA